jgi:hypothetical protein
MPFEHHVMTYWTWLLGDPLKIRFLDASTWGNIGFLLGELIILILLALRLSGFCWRPSSMARVKRFTSSRGRCMAG